MGDITAVCDYLFQKRVALDWGMEVGLPAALKVLIDADFSSQYEHIISGHDLWSCLRGGGAILGRSGGPALSLCYVCGDCAASAGAVQPSASRGWPGD